MDARFFQWLDTMWPAARAKVEADISAPSPLGTLLASLSVLAAIGVAYLLIQAYRRVNASKGGTFERFIDRLRRLDRNLIWYGSWIVGTHFYTARYRTLGSLTFFGGTAVAGVFLPWPWCLWVLTVGLLGVFVVFRQWSHTENEIEYDVSAPPKKIKTDDEIHNLSFEMTLACSCVVIYAPVAFAQMHAAGLGFHVEQTAGAYAFVGYTIIEMLKIGPLVQYYDVFADKLHFEKLGTVTSPSFEAKFALLAFRGSVDLIILAALKRFIDIAQRVAAGLDLRPQLAGLNSGDESRRQQAVRDLEKFAKEGRTKASDVLQDVLSPGSKYRPTLEMRFGAARGLSFYGERRKDPGVLRLAYQGFEVLEKAGWLDNADEFRKAVFYETRGDAYQRFGKLESYLQRLKLARDDYWRAHTWYEAAKGKEPAALRAASRTEEMNRLIRKRQAGEQAQEEASDQPEKQPAE